MTEVEIDDGSTHILAQESSDQGVLDLPGLGQSPAQSAHSTESLGIGTESLGIGTESLGIGTESLGIGTESLGIGTERSVHKKSPDQAGLFAQLTPTLLQQVDGLAGRIDSDTLADAVEALCRGGRPMSFEVPEPTIARVEVESVRYV